MCGIFGYYDLSGEGLQDDRLAAMGAAIRHRGPDDSGVFAANHAAVGNQRLSIIDVAGGHQPFVSEDGLIAVVQNGEIFNYVELAEELRAAGIICRTRSDTEVLLRMYEQEGIAFLRRLNGMFAIAILDRRNDEMYLVRDRVGVKPLYVARQGPRILFGSEIKALLAAGFKPRVDREAIDHFLTFNYVPLPWTGFEGVRHVEPGHYLRISPQGVSTIRWWDLAAVNAEEGRSESDWAEEFLELLDDAVRIRLRSDVPYGAFLSGGVDSSTIVGMMARHAGQPVRTFCIGFNDQRYDESQFAAEAARRFRTDHTSERVDPQMLDRWPHVLWHCDKPHGDASFMPTLSVSTLAARHVKVVITGDGGDELFAGYEKYRDFFQQPGSLECSEAEFRERYAHVLTLFNADAKQRLYRRSFASSVAGVRPADVLNSLYDRSDHFDRVTRALYIDVMQLLPGNNLVKPDRMGMAVSLEARTPFLDYRVVEHAFRMPGEFKLRDGQLKYAYKKAVTPLIGKHLAYRKKQMFTVPVGDWFRGQLYPYCCSMLLEGDGLTRELFETDEIARMLERHREGSANFTREIRALLALEIWARTCLEGNRAVP